MDLWRSIDIELTSDESAAALAADLVRVVAEKLELSDSAKAEVELAIVEAVNNAVEHSNKFDTSKRVFVAVSPSRARLVIRVADNGVGMSREVFERAAANMDHVASCEIDELPQRGMGLSIIKMAMEDVSYEKSGDINVLTMKKSVETRTEPMTDAEQVAT
jgi:serine/threonine-protein kinase RsbW